MALPVGAAQGQLLQRATVIENARIVTPRGVIDGATIVVRGGRIAEIGTDVDAPRMSTRIDAEGGTVTAPLIDAWSGLGLSGFTAESSAAARGQDAFDPYADVLITDALRNGVGYVYIPARGEGVAGVGAVIRLTPREGGGSGEIIEEYAAICVDLRADGAIDRLELFRDVRTAFQAALDYRETLEVYEDELETYLEELKKLKDESAEGDTDTGTGGGEDASEGNGDADEEKEKKDEGPKKPDRPRTDRNAEALLKALDREIPVRVRADRTADILNAIALAEEFKLNLIVEGAAEAGVVAADLAEADAWVVLRAADPGVLDAATGRPVIPDVAALDRAGVDWAVGSGPDFPRGGRAVLLAAQSLGDEAALARVTRVASRALSLGGGVGVVTRGAPADMVLWSGDPHDPASRVRRVWLNGESVYGR